MTITVKEIQRLSDKALLGVLDDKGVVTSTKYVDAVIWDTDPITAIAQVIRTVRERPTEPLPEPAPVPAVVKSPVVKTDAEVDAKILAIKTAENLAKIDPVVVKP